MDRSFGNCKRGRFSVISARLYRIKPTVLGSWRVTRHDISDVFHKRQDRCDGVACDCRDGWLGASQYSYQFGGLQRVGVDLLRWRHRRNGVAGKQYFVARTYRCYRNRGRPCDRMGDGDNFRDERRYSALPIKWKFDNI